MKEQPISNFVEHELMNPHYHSSMKGCEIVNRKWRYIKGGLTIYGGYCKTHKKEICRDGWEWHWIGGKFTNPVHPDLYPRVK